MVNGTVESSSPPTLVNHSVAPRSHDLPVLLHTPYVYVIVAKWQPPRMQELEEVEEHHQAACSCLGCLPLLGRTNPHSSHLRGWQSIIFCCIVFVSRLNALLAVPHCTTPPTHVSSSVCGHARQFDGHFTTKTGPHHSTLRRRQFVGNSSVRVTQIPLAGRRCYVDRLAQQCDD